MGMMRVSRQTHRDGQEHDDDSSTAASMRQDPGERASAGSFACMPEPAASRLPI
ncbi:hypothetical protein BN871_BK_00050 [Paenibacillus sp. P22]|nr:hypothetical protein BN871_BK_00050 [Paenibacillus sp. P22]